MTVMGLKMSKKRLLALFAFALMPVLILFSSGAASGAQSGLLLCAKHILPSAFPFLVLAEIIAKCIDARSVLPAVIVGNLSGYPVGGRLCTGLVKRSGADTVLLLACCIGAGPGFTVSAVGSVLNSEGAGLLLFCAQLLSSLTALVLLLILRRKQNVKAAGEPSFDCAPPFADIFVEAVKGGCTSMLYICGFVTFFSCISGVLCEISGITDGVSGVLMYGALEISNGCARASLRYGAAGFSLLGGLLGFGGVSVFFQLAAITRKSGIRIFELLLSRLLSAALGAVYSIALYSAFPAAISAAATGFTAKANIHSLPVVSALTLLICTLLCCDASTGYVTLLRKKIK